MIKRYSRRYEKESYLNILYIIQERATNTFLKLWNSNEPQCEPLFLNGENFIQSRFFPELPVYQYFSKSASRTPPGSHKQTQSNNPVNPVKHQGHFTITQQEKKKTVTVRSHRNIGQFLCMFCLCACGLVILSCLLVWMCVCMATCDGLVSHPRSTPASCPVFWIHHNPDQDKPITVSE